MKFECVVYDQVNECLYTLVRDTESDTNPLGYIVVLEANGSSYVIGAPYVTDLSYLPETRCIRAYFFLEENFRLRVAMMVPAMDSIAPPVIGSWQVAASEYIGPDIGTLSHVLTPDTAPEDWFEPQDISHVLPLTYARSSDEIQNGRPIELRSCEVSE